MVDELQDYRSGEITFTKHRIPMSLIHMVSWSDLGIAVSQFDRLLGITFEVDGQNIGVDIGQQKYLPSNPKRKGALIKRKILRHFRFFQTMIPDFFKRDHSLPD
jgi:hypothetical protein